jgi:hypothetical protein
MTQDYDKKLWAQLFVKSVEGSYKPSPGEMTVIDNHISALAPCTIVTLPHTAVPIMNAKDEWEVRIFDASFVPLLKGVLLQKFNLETVREAVHPHGEYETVVLSNNIEQKDGDVEGLKKYFKDHGLDKKCTVEKMGDHVEILCPVNFRTAIVTLVEKYGFWASQINDFVLPDAIEK